MELICCENCGVTYNKYILVFPNVHYNDDGIVMGKRGEDYEWSEDMQDYVGIVKCRVCQASILENSVWNS